MKIRREQMSTLNAVGRENFELRLTEHVRTRYPAILIGIPGGQIPVSQLSTDCLLGMVRCGISRAKKYGLTWQSSIAGFTSLMFAIGPDFDEHPAIRRELLDEAVPANSKVDNLSRVVAEPIWNEAKLGQRPLAWTVICPSLTFSRQEVKPV